MCLICNETVALVKSGKVKGHYYTKHRHLEQNSYPQNSAVRARRAFPVCFPGWPGDRASRRDQVTKRLEGTRCRMLE